VDDGSDFQSFWRRADVGFRKVGVDLVSRKLMASKCGRTKAQGRRRYFNAEIVAIHLLTTY
jgi:hypothetical protein